jgi:hypothetical protein
VRNEQLAMRSEDDNSRVCRSLFADPKAESEECFGYAGAERMCLHGKWLDSLLVFTIIIVERIVQCKKAGLAFTGGSTSLKH